MKKTILLLITVFLIGGLLIFALKTESQSSITLYVVPAMTGDKILPDTSISSSYLSDQISFKAAPGEYEPASFVVKANEAVNNLTITASNLTSGSNFISSSNIDIKVVKVWWQAQLADTQGNPVEDVWGNGGRIGKFLTPELLLNNDDLVKVEGGENYVWNNAAGGYTWISDETPVSVYSIPFSELSIQDSSTLQPVDIPQNTNKQFWITFKVPDNQEAGTYTGQIQLRANSQTIGQLNISLEVLPFELAKSSMIDSLYYWGVIGASDPGISTYSKTETQFIADQENLFEHGVINAGLSAQVNENLLRTTLSVRQGLGMTNNQPLFFHKRPFSSSNPPQTEPELQEVRDTVSYYVQIAREYGVTDVYFYAIDEADPEFAEAEIPALQAVHEAGGLVFSSSRWDVDIFGILGDLVDVNVRSYPFKFQDTEAARAKIAQWHSVGSKVLFYAVPQAGVENPLLYRRNFGLRLWQIDSDGRMDFAHQFSNLSNPWNDFDCTYNKVRDHNFTYPTDDGSIDTIEWEGYREGIDDTRYLTTLLNAIAEAKGQGKDTSQAETYLANLKDSNLETKNLYTVRSEIIDHILYLLDQETPTPFSVSFVSPTDPNGATVDRDWTEVNVLTEGSLDSSSFIDWDESLIGYWDFNNTANDKSTYDNDGVVSGAQWTTGKFSSALSFDGTDDYVVCGEDSSFSPLNITGEITIEAWVKWQGAVDGSIVSKLTGTDGYGLVGKHDSSLEFYIHGGSDNRTHFSSSNVFSPGSWYHVAATFSDQENMAKIYVNGSLDTSQTITHGLTVGSTDFKIGKDSWWTGNYLSGIIDEVRVWDRALSLAEIRSSYNSKTYQLSRQFTNLANGTYQYYAHAADIAGNSDQTETRTLTVSTSAAPLNIDITLEAKPILGNRSLTIYIYQPGTETLIYQKSENTDSQDDLSLDLSDFSYSRSNPYDIEIKVPGFLIKRLNVSNLIDPIDFPGLEIGDLTSDNMVNSFDWSELQANWYTSDPDSDLNEDGIVNTIDFSFMNKNWMKTGN